MSLTEQVQKDMTAAMRSREELRLSTLRMMKTALKNKEIDKRAPLDEKEELQVLSTLIKQRKDSIEAFEKGNRPELARKEAEEIAYIEAYMPKAVGEDEIVAAVRAGRQLVHLNPLRETGYQVLMRALARQGNVAEALSVYGTLSQLLRDELGVYPSATTAAVYQELLQP